MSRTLLSAVLALCVAAAPAFAQTPMKLGLDGDVTNVAANGDITYAFRFAEASMDGPGLPPMPWIPSRGSPAPRR